jgi:hypothetical protein
MALAFLNRCGFRATSTGTGSFVVASALTGMQTPAQAAGPAAVNAATYRYFAQSDDLTQWEYGTGVYTTGDVTLTRATVYDNSSAGTTPLSFSAAPRVYMGGPLAQDGHNIPELLGFVNFGDNPSDTFDVAIDITKYEAFVLYSNYLLVDLPSSPAPGDLLRIFLRVLDGGGSTLNTLEISLSDFFNDYDGANWLGFTSRVQNTIIVSGYGITNKYIGFGNEIQDNVVNAAAYDGAENRSISGFAALSTPATLRVIAYHLDSGEVPIAPIDMAGGTIAVYGIRSQPT